VFLSVVDERRAPLPPLPQPEVERPVVKETTQAASFAAGLAAATSRR
jgi:hypothetical protein